MIANDDLLLLAILTFNIIFLWDTLNRVESVNKAVAPAAAASESQNSKVTPIKKVEKAVDPNTLVDNGTPAEASVKGALSPPTATATAKSGRAVVLPYLPGCEPDGPAAKEMTAKYPDCSIEDIVRYLVARKGNVAAASEMLEKCTIWRANNFPLKRSQLSSVYKSEVMFYHGTARDGTPVIYFRGGLYDKNKGSPETHVLGAAHCIDVALSTASTINVTVLVHTSNVEGGPNAAADMNFIKAFVAVRAETLSVVYMYIVTISSITCSYTF